jgi:hypothetical protein
MVMRFSVHRVLEGPGSHIAWRSRDSVWCWPQLPFIFCKQMSGYHLPNFITVHASSSATHFTSVTFAVEKASLSNCKYSRVSFCDGSFYDVSLLWLLSSRTAHSRILVHYCRNSSVLSLLNALLDLILCPGVHSLSILVQFFKLTVIFPPMTPTKKTEKKKKSKQLTLHSFLMSSKPRPGPSSSK